MFEEKVIEFNDSMHDIGQAQPQLYIKQNAEMLKSCPLFENGGNYSSEEIAWYREQMSEIDQMFSAMQEARETQIGEINE